MFSNLVEVMTCIRSLIYNFIVWCTNLHKTFSVLFHFVRGPNIFVFNDYLSNLHAVNLILFINNAFIADFNLLQQSLAGP
jgi:hypothetical protein